MTEENTVEEAVIDAPADNAPPARDFEQEARDSGWVPEAEFKGDKKPAVFLDAETFVRRGEELIPVIRRVNKKLKQELDETKADFAKRLAAIEKVNKTTFEAQQRQHVAELARVRREQRAAVVSGDEAEFDRLETERTNLEKSAPKADEPEKIDPNADLSTRQDAWRAANPWFDEDFELQEYAIKYSDFHGRKNPKMSFEDNMKAVEAEVRRKFPEKFGGKKPAANGHAAVDGGSDFFAIGGKPDPLAKLPAEAREQAKSDMKAFPKIYPSPDAWIKAYNS